MLGLSVSTLRWLESAWGFAKMRTNSLLDIECRGVYVPTLLTVHETVLVLWCDLAVVSFPDNLINLCLETHFILSAGFLSVLELHEFSNFFDSGQPVSSENEIWSVF